MKKFLFSSFLFCLLLLTLVGCNQAQSQGQGQIQGQSQDDATSQVSSDGPDAVVSDFLKALQQENYASVKSSYSENLDNMANFRNQIEDISPSVAN